MLFKHREDLLQQIKNLRLRLMVLCQHSSYLSDYRAIGHLLKIIDLRQTQQLAVFQTVNLLSGGNFQLQTGKGLQQPAVLRT